MKYQLLLTISAAALLMTGSAIAGEKPASAKTKPVKAAPAGMVVSRDPQAGKLRQPSQEELDQLTAQGAASTARMAPALPLSHASGAIGVTLTEDQLVFMVAKKGPDGKVSFDCLQGPGAAAKALKTPAPKHPLRGGSDVQ